MSTNCGHGFGNDCWSAYNEAGYESQGPREGDVKRTLTAIRCVPRYGYDHAQVRTVDIDLADPHDDDAMLRLLRAWFDSIGVPDAVYDLAVDDDGFFAVNFLFRTFTTLPTRCGS